MVETKVVMGERKGEKKKKKKQLCLHPPSTHTYAWMLCAL